RAQEDLCPAAPGGQSHGGIAPQRRRGHQRRRTAQGSLGNPSAQTGVRAIAHRAAMLPLADSRNLNAGSVAEIAAAFARLSEQRIGMALLGADPFFSGDAINSWSWPLATLCPRSTTSASSSPPAG